MSELVSIIVSAYNVEEYLPKCLESVSRQTYKTLDIILIDDGSTDGSGAICDSFAAKDPRARVFHQENQGLWAVRNRGQQESMGEYLLFVDGDDYFHDDYVRLLYEGINKDGHQYPMAVCVHRQVKGDEGDLAAPVDTTYFVKDREQLIEGFFDDSLYWLLSSNWDKMYRKAYLDIPFQHPYPRCQDMDSNLRAIFSKVDHAIFLSSTLYYYRIREGQVTRAKDYLSKMNYCISSIYYNNYVNLPKTMIRYRHLVLLNLYRRLRAWKEYIYSSGSKNDVHKLSYFEKRTVIQFLFCCKIPLIRRIRILVRMHFPRLCKLLVKKD
jgi:glycosyltransferase involved in cell wall biosynthesis